MNLEYRMIAPCYFGAESAAAFDIRRIGAKDVTVTDGRVAFTGGAGVLAAANLHSRCAERILLLLKTGRAETFDALFDLAYSVPWEELMPADAAFPVKGSSLSSQLSSVPACQSIVKKAVVERLKKGHRVQVLPESGGEYRIRFSLRKNEAEIMLDTSGEGLHKRGYRRQSTLAPIKETLACAMLDLGRIYPDSTVQDPFCGSGTLCIEAAMKALHIAPGLHRRFAAERYAFVPAGTFQRARADALEQVVRDAPFEAVGFDIDGDAVALAAHNAKLAVVASHVRFYRADVKDFAPRAGSLVFTNPPYGEHLGDAGTAAALERTLGQRLAACSVKGAYIITADSDFEAHFGRKAQRRRKLYNGMIPCQVYMYY